MKQVMLLIRQIITQKLLVASVFLSQFFVDNLGQCSNANIITLYFIQGCWYTSSSVLNFSLIAFYIKSCNYQDIRNPDSVSRYLGNNTFLDFFIFRIVSGSNSDEKYSLPYMNSYKIRAKLQNLVFQECGSQTNSPFSQQHW